MEGGLPMLNCLLQHTLRSLCSSSDSSNSSKWVYAVFWRILPRNYPPPKWDYGGGVLDRSKGNKRNWILVWEDGYCDFLECERAVSGYMKGRFGPDVFFKMSHEVYNYGEGLVGKVAGENSHKWVFREPLHENDSKFVSSSNGSMDPQPKAWEFQFNSGIQTIAIISVREGIIQLGSLNKIDEDLNLVISIQRKFSYLQSIPGVFAMQRPYLPTQNSNSFKFSCGNEPDFWADEKRNLTGGKRCYGERLDESPCKSINLGWNNPQNSVSGGPFWSIPPLLPSMSCSLGALLSKLPSVIPSHSAIKAHDTELDNPSMATNWASKVTGLGQNSGIKMEPCVLTVSDEEKPKTHLHNSSSEDEEGDEPSVWGLEVREDRRDKEEIALIKLN